MSGGAGNASESQNMANELRLDPGGPPRWPKGTWVRLGLAAIPLLVVIVLAFIASR